MKIAIAYPLKFWLHKHSPTRRHYIEALMRHSECTFVAPGWKGYVDGDTWQENCKRMLPEADAAIFYKPDGNPKLGVRPMKDWQSTETFKVTCFNEFWWPKERRHEEVAGYDLCVAHHENDLDRFHEVGAEVIHIPHSADFDTFYSESRERTGPPLLTGTCGEEHYPFRCRLQRLVASGAIKGRIRRHPGYWMKTEAENQGQVANYAADLANTRISICTTSKWKYALAKYFESWMAGCVVAGDLPDDDTYAPFFRSLQIVLDPEWSDGQIVDAISSVPDEELEARALAGQDRARRHFTTDLYANRLMAHLDSIL